MTPEYPTNSNKSKEEPRMVEAVVTNPVGVRKKKKSKLLRMIFRQDFKDIKPGLVTDYVEPKVQDIAWSFIQSGIDLVTNALRMMVYEDYKPTDRSRLPADRYTYSNYYSSSSPRPVPTMTSELSYDEFTYTTKAEADVVLAELKNLIDRTKAASVLDLYNLSKVPTSNYTLQDWGWKNLDFAEVKQTFDDEHRIVYVINLPKASPLGR